MTKVGIRCVHVTISKEDGDKTGGMYMAKTENIGLDITAYARHPERAYAFVLRELSDKLIRESREMNCPVHGTEMQGSGCYDCHLEARPETNEQEVVSDESKRDA